MPNYEIPFPVGAKNTRAVYNKVSYPIGASFLSNRTGEDGNIPILHLFGSTYFNGEILEGQWHKGWGASMTVFTASIQSDKLALTGVSNSAGAARFAWINGQNPILLIDTTVVEFSMETPVDDTGVTASRDINQTFYLKQDKNEINPNDDNNYIQIFSDVDETGIIYYIKKEVNGTLSTLASGKDYNMAGDKGTGNLKATVWKLTFNGKPGTSGATLTITLRQSDTIANASLADENEVDGSPFDISDLAYHIGYPAIYIKTQNTTYFGTEIGSSNAALVGKIQVTYPDDIQWESTVSDANKNKGDAELWDGIPNAVGSVRVMDANHKFSKDAYLQNSLTRLHINDLIEYGLDLYGYYGSSWNLPVDRIYFRAVDSAAPLTYPKLQCISSITPDKIVVKIRLRDSATVDEDIYIDCDITISRGEFGIKIVPTAIVPLQDIRIAMDDSTQIRFGYVGDDAIGDDDVGETGINSTMSDNFVVVFDDAGEAVLVTLSTIKQTDADFRAIDGGDIQFRETPSSDVLNTAFWMSITPFPLIANLFVEAEDATISAAARLYMDGEGEDTVTEGQAVWAATLNCVIDIDDATDPQVGVKDVKITSSGAGNVQTTMTPGNPLSIIKFDNLRGWVRKIGGSDNSISIRITDEDGDFIQIIFDVTGSMTQFDFDLPHSSTDLQGWSESNTFRFDEPYNNIKIANWNADGAGEIVLLDGLHFYIGTTTTRGRGETLSGGEAVVLDVEDNFVRYFVVPNTDLPFGLFAVYARIKDTDQVADDMRINAYNENASEQIDQSNATDINHTLTSSFQYIPMIMFFKDSYSGDNVRIQSSKDTSTENTIFVDYILIVPLSNGKDWPADIAHNAFRTLGLQKDVQITDG